MKFPCRATVAGPPAAGTLITSQPLCVVPVMIPVARIVPSGPHEASFQGFEADAGDRSHIVCAAPPFTEMRFSLVSVKNPIDLLSGDQNGPDAPSVPSSATATVDARSRTNK